MLSSSSLSLSVGSQMLSSFENSAKEFAMNCIRECALRRGFDANEELELLGLMSVKASVVDEKKDDSNVVIKIARKKKVLTENLKKKVAVETSNNVEVVEEKFSRVKIDGKQYLKNKSNVLFDILSREKVGIYNDGKMEVI